MSRRNCLDARDRIEEIASCYEAIGDLISPCPDIQGMQRDHIAVLMGLLAREHQAAFEQLHRACPPEEA